MKKIFSALLIACLMAGHSFASQVPQNATIMVSVMVTGNFNLMVNSDSFDFARMVPGQTGDMSRGEGITVAGVSSSGDPWYIKVNADPLTSGSDMISNDNLTWYGSTEGSGKWNGAVEKSLANDNHTAYASTATEATDSVRIASKFKFRLHVPEDTKPGSYTTAVMFTMTE